MWSFSVIRVPRSRCPVEKKVPQAASDFVVRGTLLEMNEETVAHEIALLQTKIKELGRQIDGMWSVTFGG